MYKRFFGGWLELEFVIALLLVLPLAVPFFQQAGLPNTADAEIHLHRMVSTAANLQAGILWPRWTPYLHHGFGYPIHNFYAPGLHLIGGAAWLITGVDGVLLWKIIQTAALLLYPAGAYLFARTFAGQRSALVAAVVYTYAPFRFDELWQQSNLSQFAAMALLPFLFWALARGAQQPRRTAIASIGGWFAAIVLLHHPTGFLVAPFAGLYALWMGLASTDEDVARPVSTRLKRLSVLLAGLALGVALSAVFWLPALGEFRYVQIQRIEQGAFNAAANLIPLPALLRPLLPIDQTQQNFARFFTPGLAQVTFVVIGLLALWPRLGVSRAAKRNLLFGTGAFLLCLFLMTPASAWLWQNLPIARFVVYPWRLLGVAALAAIPSAALLPTLVSQRWQTPIAGGMIALTALTALPLLYTPLTFYTIGELTPGEAFIYEKRTGNVGLTSGNEYLPIWATQRPIAGNPRDHLVLEWRIDFYADTLPDDVQFQRLLDGCSARQTCYQLEITQPNSLQFNQMYYPGWQVALNGQPFPVRPEGIHGLITFDVPAGTHRLTIEYVGTPLQHGAEIVSLVSLVIAAGLLITRQRPVSPLSTTGEGTDASPRLALMVGGGLIVFTLLNMLILVPHTDFMRPRGDPRLPPAQTAAAITFDDRVTLVGYDLSTTRLNPGESVTITLYWLLEHSVERLPRVSVQVVDAVTGEVWARAESPGLAGQNPINWPVGKYATETLSLTVNADAPPYVGDLRLALYDTGDTLRYWRTGEQDFAVLTPIRVLGDVKSDVVLAPTKVTLGGQITLQGYALTRDEAETCVLLRWHVETPPTADLAVMLHLRDAKGQMLTAADAAPLNNRYPSSLWQAGQTLEDRHCFAVPPDAMTLAVGLYQRANVTPLAMTAGGDGTAFMIPLNP